MDSPAADFRQRFVSAAPPDLESDAGSQPCDLLRCSALGGNRTPNLLIRSQMLYPLSYERRLAV